MTQIIIIAAIVVVLLIFILSSYKKVPKNKIGIRVGPFGNKTVTGRGIIVIPFIQRIDYMTLENIQVDFESRSSIPTQDAINIKVDAVANVVISQSPDVMKRAASRFTGYSTSRIAEVVTPVLEGNIREIISQMKLKDLIQGDKKILADTIAENVKPNLADLGLELTTFNIQNFKDDNGVINNLGIENTVSISKDAAKAKAAAEAEVKIAQAEAAKAANDAEVQAQLEIAKKQNDLALKRAELKAQSDNAAAKAEAAKQIESEVQRKEKEIKEAEANIARQEKEIELAEKKVAVKEKALEAEVEKTAEAQKFAAQQAADADLYSRQKAAEAEAYERKQKADVEAYERERKAEAEKKAAEAEAAGKKSLAEAVQAQGEAEAAAIKAKLEAEAEGEKQKLLAKAEGQEKLAEALAKMDDKGTLQMQLETLKVIAQVQPAVAQAVADGYSKVGTINMYGGDSSQLSSNIMTTLNQVNDGLGQSLGVDLKSIANGLLGGVIAGAVNKKEN